MTMVSYRIVLVTLLATLPGAILSEDAEAVTVDRLLTCTNPAYPPTTQAYPCSGEIRRTYRRCGSDPASADGYMYEFVCREEHTEVTVPTPPAPTPAQPDVIPLSGCVGSPRWHRTQSETLSTQFNSRCTREGSESAGRSELFFSSLSSDPQRRELKRLLYRTYSGQMTPEEAEATTGDLVDAREQNAIERKLAALEQALTRFEDAAVRAGGTRRLSGVNRQLLDAQMNAIRRRIGLFRNQIRVLAPDRVPESDWSASRRRALMEQVGWLSSGFSDCEFDAVVCRRRQAGNLQQLVEGIGEPVATAEGGELEANAITAAGELKTAAQALLAGLTDGSTSEFAATLTELNEVSRCRALATNRDAHARSARLQSCQAYCASQGGIYGVQANGSAQCRRGGAVAEGTTGVHDHVVAPPDPPVGGPGTADTAH